MEYNGLTEPTEENESTQAFLSIDLTGPREHTPIQPTQQPQIEALTEHNDLGARERCFDRYYKLYHWVTGIFVFANVLTYFILFVINMYHKFPTDIHDHLFGALITSLLSIVGLYALVHICVLGYEHMCGRKCQVPLCCGCRWIERHQLQYENPNN